MDCDFIALGSKQKRKVSNVWTQTTIHTSAVGNDELHFTQVQRSFFTTGAF